VTDEPIRPETIALLKRTLPVVEYIHIDRLTQGDPPLLKSSAAAAAPRYPPRATDRRRGLLRVAGDQWHGHLPVF
jgi:hypothetical protein